MIKVAIYGFKINKSYKTVNVDSYRHWLHYKSFIHNLRSKLLSCFHINKPPVNNYISQIMIKVGRLMITQIIFVALIIFN